jgi:hypothetical protein
LRRSELTEDTVQAVAEARRAFSAFSACRILEVARIGEEIPTTRFQLGRAIVTAIQKSGEAAPLGLKLGRYATELIYAGALFQSVSMRSVNDFHRIANRWWQTCKDLGRAHR